MSVKFSNNGKTTTTQTVDDDAAVVSVHDVSVFPTISGDEYFYVTLDDSSGDLEICKVTSVNTVTKVLSVTRAQEGTTAQDWGIGTKVENRLTAGGLNDVTSDYLSSSGGTISGNLDVTGNLDANSISTNGFLLAGDNSGGVGLSHNDGYGNANVTFNHQSGTPHQDGNAARIEVNTDATNGDDVYMSFEGKSDVTAGTATGLNTMLQLGVGSVKVPFKIEHIGDADTFIAMEADKVYLKAGDVTKYNSNNWDNATTLNTELQVKGGLVTNEISPFQPPGTTYGPQQLVLNAGESQGKVVDSDGNSTQTGEFVYANAEGGLRVSTPDSDHANWASGYTVKATNITGESITIDGNEVWHQGNDGADSGLDADKLDGKHASHFPLRANGTVTGDFDNYTTSGNYYVSNWNPTGGTPITNGPTYTFGDSNETQNAYGFGMLRVSNFNSNNNFIVQEYIAHQNDGIWMRVYWSTHGWSPWRQQYTNLSDGNTDGLNADTLDGGEGADYFRKSVNFNTNSILTLEGDNPQALVIRRNSDANAGIVLANENDDGSIKERTYIGVGTADGELKIGDEADVLGQGNTVWHTGTLTTTNKSNYDTAYGWGDHSTEGYLTTTDISGKANLSGNNTFTGSITAKTFISTPQVPDGNVEGGEIKLEGAGTSEDVYIDNYSGDIRFFDSTQPQVRARLNTDGDLELTGELTATGYNNSNWDTAYGWGNHASAGYLTSVPNHSAAKLTSGTLHNDRLSTDMILEAAAPRYRLKETGVTNTPDWWMCADGGNLSFRLNNSGPYPIQFTTNADNNAVSSVNVGYDLDVNGDISADNFNNSNWDTAHGWGNHASAGYLTAVPSKQSPATSLELGNVDLDDYAQPADAGFYHQTANADADTEDNWPNGRAGSLLVQRAANSGNFGATQLFIDYNNSDVYVRSMYGDAAADRGWKRLYDTSDFTNNASNWDTAYGWGNHASAGYLTSLGSAIVDGDFTSNGLMKRSGNGSYTSVTDNSSNWDAAHGWGNHASAGYATTFNSLSSKENGTGTYATTGRFVAGTSGSGQVALTTNDGGGNANVTFNDAGNAPDNAGYNRGRITVNVDSTTSASMTLEVGSGGNGPNNGFVIKESGVETPGTVTASGGNSGNWNTAYGWGNHASAGYLTSHQNISGKANLSGATFTGDIKEAVYQITLFQTPTKLRYVGTVCTVIEATLYT